MLAFSSHFRYQLLKSFAIRRRRCGLTEVAVRSEEHTSELQSRLHLVCRLLLEKKNHRLHQPPQWLLRAPRSPFAPLSPPSRSRVVDLLRTPRAAHPQALRRLHVSQRILAYDWT